MLPGGYNSPNTARAWAYITAIAVSIVPYERLFECPLMITQRGEELLPDTPIPDHVAFPLYAPAFTMEVPAGYMRDENTDNYIREVEKVYSQITLRLREKCGAEQASALNSEVVR